MPCTLEARTVIKTSCGRSAILTLFENRWKAKSQVSSKVETKQTPNKNTNHENTPKEDTQKTKWNTTLSENTILITLSTSSRWHSNS